MMGKYFGFKKTRMVDEATLYHRPQSVFQVTFIFLAVLLVASLAEGLISAVPMVLKIFTDAQIVSDILLANTIDEMVQATNDFLETYSSFIYLIELFSSASLIVCAVLYCRFLEKRPISSLGFRGGVKNFFCEYGIGFFIGALLFGATVGLALLTKSATIEKGTAEPILVLYLMAFIIQGAGEEIMLRGYYMISLSRDRPLWVSVLFSSLVFALLHASNTGFSALAMVNLMLFGALEGIYIYKRGDIFGACALHTAWNFFEGNVFGTSVSGASALPSLLRVTFNEERTLANGGAFGFEGGACCSILLLLGLGLLMLTKQKESELSETVITESENIQQK